MKDGWKIIMTSNLPQNIYLAQTYLESEGIPTLLQDELTAQVHNFYATAIGGVKMLVPNEEAGRAAGLLAEAGYVVERHIPDGPLETIRTADRQHCPYCHSTDIAQQKKGDWLILAFYFVLGLFIPVFRPVYTCFECGKNWRSRNPQ